MGNDDGSEARVDISVVGGDVEGLVFAVGNKAAVDAKTALITRALEKTGMGQYQ